jgi:hypothetical protein
MFKGCTVSSTAYFDFGAHFDLTQMAEVCLHHPLGWRPPFGHPNAERLLGLDVLGFVFSLAYSRRLPVILVLLAGALAVSNTCSIS